LRSILERSRYPCISLQHAQTTPASCFLAHLDRVVLRIAPPSAERFEPKLFTVLKEGYSFAKLGRDAVAGVIVGIIALPLAIAFGIASGVKPEQGLYTAIVAGFLISALGGSRVQIGGPTGAFIVIVYGVVERFGYEGLAVATFIAGILLVLMGLARLGTVIKFVPYPVTVGFTGGIALIIAASQVNDFLGLGMERVPADFIEKLGAYGEHIGSWNPWAAAVGLATIVCIVYWPRVSVRIPGPLVAILATTAAVRLVGIPIETIGDRFGAVPSSLPSPSPLPAMSLAEVRQLFPAAISIAILGAIESLLSAVVADGMVGGRHRSNTELIAQGIANITSPFFGGIPATGAIARTATNVKNGGRSPVAGIVHALTLLVIMYFFAGAAAWIPMATLAGILLVVAYNMSEWRVFAHLFRSPRSDVIVLLTTFVLTVVIDLTIALQVGIVLAAFLFMRRVAVLSDTRVVDDLTLEKELSENGGVAGVAQVPSGVEIFEVQGMLFFGAASKFKDALRQTSGKPRVLILHMRDVFAVDATGLRALEDILDKARADGTTVVLSEARDQPREAIVRAGLVERLGVENLCETIDDALDRAREIVDVASAGALRDVGPDLPPEG
jgi:SulP family sulfate permease